MLEVPKIPDQSIRILKTYKMSLKPEDPQRIANRRPGWDPNNLNSLYTTTSDRKCAWISIEFWIHQQLKDWNGLKLGNGAQISGKISDPFHMNWYYWSKNEKVELQREKHDPGNLKKEGKNNTKGAQHRQQQRQQQNQAQDAFKLSKWFDFKLQQEIREKSPGFRFPSIISY